MIRPRVLVVGCGAMGALLAAHLAAVAEVSAFDIDAAQVLAVQAEGGRVEGVRTLQARIHATDRVEALAGCRFDAIVFLVKSGATAAGLRNLALVLAESGSRALLVTLQNGMGNAEALLAAPDLPVARGVSMAIVDPMDAVWSKFDFNGGMNPVGALLLGINAARYDVPEVRDLIDDMAAECRAVALGGCFAFDPMEYVHRVRQGALPLSAHAGSMALDIARGADTEIEELIGHIVREADHLGLPVPACRTVIRSAKGLEFAARLRHPMPTQTETTRS